MPIQILPPILANQIAAGEVVERPASVVKELVENCLDAGATRIDIELEKGGIQLIRIRDNGSGISKEDLTLSLARHATSKVATIDDLENIVSLGFRGEALASISSVSRLTLTSRTANQNEAWQAYAEGRDMVVTVKPASHPIGTTVEVLDLFFNTPARRRFLRSEKTEFAHIDELIRRLALSRFDVSFSLKHNGKLLRQYRPSVELAQKSKRVAIACGNEFSQNAIWFESEHLGLKLSGWLAQKALTNIADIQYSYVNGRMMRDKLLTHAIRQAFNEYFLNDQILPAYIVYLEIDPRQVDVNVHPAKHEVRFHEARNVHDFVVSVVRESLQQFNSNVVSSDEYHSDYILEDHASNYPVSPLRIRKSGHSYSHSNSGYRPGVQELNIQSKFLENAAFTALSQTEVRAVNDASTAKFLSLIQSCFALIQKVDDLYLFDLNQLHQKRQLWLLVQQFKQGLTAQPLLIPQRVQLGEQSSVIQTHQAWLEHLGIRLQLFKQNIWIIQTVPAFLRQTDLATTIPSLLEDLAKIDVDLNEEHWGAFLQSFSSHLTINKMQWTEELASQIWLWFSSSENAWDAFNMCYQKIDLHRYTEVFLRD